MDIVLERLLIVTVVLGFLGSCTRKTTLSFTRNETAGDSRNRSELSERKRCHKDQLQCDTIRFTHVAVAEYADAGKYSESVFDEKVDSNEIIDESEYETENLEKQLEEKKVKVDRRSVLSLIFLVCGLFTYPIGVIFLLPAIVYSVLVLAKPIEYLKRQRARKIQAYIVLAFSILGVLIPVLVISVLLLLL